jgi:integrase
LPKVLTLAQIAAVIAAQRRLRDRFLFALLAETGMRVFVNLWAAEIGAPLRYGAPDALGRRTRARVGFDFHPHMFRHTFVTIARRATSWDAVGRDQQGGRPRLRADDGGHL